MFDLLQHGTLAEADLAGAFDASADCRVDLLRELDPAEFEAAVRELQGLLARLAAHRRVSPDWPAPESPWVGYVPGPELATAATRRLADPGLSQAQRLDCIDAITRSISALQGARADAVAAFTEIEVRESVAGVGVGLKSAQAELEFLLKLSPTAASNLMNRSLALRSLPATRAALRAGAICEAHAHAVVEETALLDAQQKRAVEDRLFPDANAHTEPALKRAVRTAIAALDPELVKKRHAAEKRRRDVSLSPCPFGMTRLNAYLTAAEAQAIFGVVKAHAKSLRGDGRNWGERKAVAFAEFFLGSKSKPRPRISTQVRVVIPAGTALGLTDDAGYLAGYGPIPADLARELAADGTWRRLLTDPANGEVLDHGTTRYRPGRRLIERVRARDGQCDAPGCQHHHDVKHLPGWKVRRNRDGTTTWTTPHGKTYVSRPPRFTPKRR